MSNTTLEIDALAESWEEGRKALLEAKQELERAERQLRNSETSLANALVPDTAKPGEIWVWQVSGSLILEGYMEEEIAIEEESGARVPQLVKKVRIRKP